MIVIIKENVPSNFYQGFTLYNRAETNKNMIGGLRIEDMIFE